MARSFTYDAENRQVTACLNCAQGSPTATYAYDGLGQRVTKTVSGPTTTYVYDAFGNLAAEYGGESSACGTCYVTTDHLGSTRLLTNAGGVFARYDYEPFGQEIGANYDGRTTAMGFFATPDGTNPPDGANPKYTGQQRDQETSTPGTSFDWFQVRYLSGAQGRFQSPDPGNAGADPSNPQSWNGYAYVGNNPLSYTDPSGEDGLATLIGCDFGPGGCAVGAAIDIGALLGGLFGLGGGPPPSIAPSLATPSSPIMGPTFSATGWGTADTVAPSWSAVDGVIPMVIPGLLFFAEGTAKPDSFLSANKRQLACTADATLNFGLGFIPGYNLGKAVVGLAGFNVHPFEAIATQSTAPLTAGGTLAQNAAGAGSLNQVIQLERFKGAGGQAALDRLLDLTNRAGFTLHSAESQAKDLAKLAQLSKLAKGVSAAGTVANLLNVVSYGYDVYHCW
jgi:RHS repeat-associated protein